MLNIYKNSNKNNNNIISQSKIVLINITLISTIAEWESEYKQYRVMHVIIIEFEFLLTRSANL